MSNAVDNEKKIKPYPKKIVYPLLVIVFLTCLIATIPAQLIGKLLPNNINNIHPTWGGTIWNGQLLIKQDSWTQFNWKLHPWALFQGRIRVDLNSLGNISLMSHVNIGIHDWFIEMPNGLLPSDLINTFLPSGSHFDGSLTANQIIIQRIKKTGEWQSASGKLNWEGGNFEFLMNGTPKKVSLPPLTLHLSTLQKSLLITLEERDSRAILATLSLDEHNISETKIRERLLRYSSDYHSENNQLDDVIVVSKQSL